MVKAFCPGHITCFFQPSDPGQADLLRRGSRGAGLRLSLGSEAVLEERSDDRVRVTIDGVETSAPVTEYVMSQMLPGRGYDVIVSNGLPCGEGFGMSASGAIAVALCAADILGEGMPAVYRAAHKADIVGGGGLGDVSAISCPVHQPVRVDPGLPPRGRVVGTGIRFERLTLAVLGSRMDTGKVLADGTAFRSISSAGEKAMGEFMRSPDKGALFRISNGFSASSGVEGPEVASAIARLRSAGMMSAMCMLGNSIFADASEDEVREVLGDVRTYACSSTDELPKVIRRE